MTNKESLNPGVKSVNQITYMPSRISGQITLSIRQF